MNVAELVIKLLLDGAGVKAEAARVDDALADVEKQAKDAGKSLDDMGRDGERSLDALDRMADRLGSGLLSVAKRVGGALAALWSVDAIQAAAAAYYEQAAAIDQTAQSLGLSIERLQAWQGAAATVGGEAEEIADRFRDMSDYIIDATKFDSGPLKDIAAELGITLKNASGEARSTEDVMLDLADAFQRVGAQASTAFGMQMSFDPATIALLQKGRGELEMLLNVQQENAAFSKEDAELARKQKIAVMALSMAWQGFVNGLMRLASPIITAITEGLGKVTAFLSRNSRAVGLTLTAIATVITASLIPALAGMATAAWAAIAPFAPFIAAAVALGLALDDLWAFVEGGGSAFESFLRWMGQTDDQVEHTRSLFRALAGVLGGFGELLASAFTFDADGILAALVSNNHAPRVETFNASLGLPAYADSRKPFKKNMLRAMQALGVTPRETAVLGDQLLTDAYAGLRLGMPALIVPPIRDKTTPFFRFKRLCERPFIRRYARQHGWQDWMSFWHIHPGK